MAKVDAVRMSYGQVESLIGAMMRVHDDRESSLVARFKLLRKLQFPPGVNIGRGRFAYGRDALMQTALVFALMDAAVLPAQAVALVGAEWAVIGSEIDRVLQALDLDEDASRSARPRTGRLLVVEARALRRWAEPGDPCEDEGVRPGLPGMVSLRTAQEIRGMLDGPDPLPRGDAGTPPFPPGLVVIDLPAVVAWTARAAFHAGWATKGQLIGPSR